MDGEVEWRMKGEGSWLGTSGMVAAGGLGGYVGDEGAVEDIYRFDVFGVVWRWKWPIGLFHAHLGGAVAETILLEFFFWA